MSLSERVDITRFSFDDFILFMFDRDAPSRAEKRIPWYCRTEATFDLQRVCDYYVRLFRQPGFLLDKFSKPQLEQAFWAIPSSNLNCSALSLIFHADLPLAARQECVRSMFDLFASLFANEPLDTSVHMWWDALCFDWDCGNRDRRRGGDDLAMQDVMFETLARILGLDSEICQSAALHGLGHLHHPETSKLIQNYLSHHPFLSTARKDYALAAARFEIM